MIPGLFLPSALALAFALVMGAESLHAYDQRAKAAFGAGHKYWFLEKLRGREDVDLVDLRPYLPGGDR